LHSTGFCWWCYSATEVNAIVGCLVSATGLIALAAPLIIETDNSIDERNRQEDFNKHGRDTMVNNDKSNWREDYDWTDLNDEPVQDSKKKSDTIRI
jgi:hypothetical protein